MTSRRPNRFSRPQAFPIRSDCLDFRSGERLPEQAIKSRRKPDEPPVDVPRERPFSPTKRQPNPPRAIRPPPFSNGRNSTRVNSFGRPLSGGGRHGCSRRATDPGGVLQPDGRRLVPTWPVPPATIADVRRNCLLRMSLRIDPGHLRMARNGPDSAIMRNMAKLANMT